MDILEIKQQATDEQTRAAPPASRRSIFQIFMLAGLCIAGIAAVGSLAFWVNKTNSEHHNNVFRQFAESRFWSLESNLLNDQANMQALAVIMSTFDATGRDQFKAITNKLLFGDTSIKFMAWTPRTYDDRSVPPEGTITETEPGNAEPDLHGGTRPAGTRRGRYRVLYSEPAGELQSAPDFDISSMPELSEALRFSCDSGEMSIVSPNRLTISSKQDTDVLFVLPVYEAGKSVKTLRERRQHLRGFLLAISDVARVFRKSATRLKSSMAVVDVDLFLFDKAASLGNQLIYSSLPEPHLERNLLKGLHVAHSIEMISLDWLMIVTPSGERNTLVAAIPGTLIFIIGTLAVFLLVIYVYRVMRQTLLIERKVDERTSQLRESESRVRTILESSPIPLVVTRVSDELNLYANTSLRTLFGFAPGDWSSIKWLDFCRDPRDRKHLRSELRASGSICDMEVSFKRPDGSNFHTLLNAYLTSFDGQDAIFCGIMDISDRKASEEALRKTQKLDAVGQLTGGIAHDFNNMLGVVIGNLELIGLRDDLDDELKTRLAKAFRAAKRSAELTKRLLGFSRTFSEETNPTSVNQVIGNLEELTARSLTAAVEIDYRLADGLWLVDIDPGEFEDALLNLFINARDAMPEGGTLTIETANKVLDDDYVLHNPGSRTGDFVWISVSDTGAGMTKDVRDKAFEPFFSTKPEGKGTGLGLSMVYGFVQRAGGLITVYSEVGAGTTFRICLPRSCDEKPDNAGKAVRAGNGGEISQELPRGTETILIVDDEEALVDLAVARLDRLGYRTLTAANGEDALTVLTDNADIDLLFSDIIMPGKLDGYQLAQAALAHRPTLKVLLTSGFTKGRRSGLKEESSTKSKLASRMLSKPYNQAELAMAIRRALDEKG